MPFFTVFVKLFQCLFCPAKMILWRKIKWCIAMSVIYVVKVLFKRLFIT